MHYWTGFWLVVAPKRSSVGTAFGCVDIQQWLLERHDYQTPIQVCRNLIPLELSASCAVTHGACSTRQSARTVSTG